MKKLIAASAVILSAMLSPARSADMPVKASPVASSSWTGFYLFGGGGFGLWNAKEFDLTLAGVPLDPTGRSSGHGWFGTVGVGFDRQIAPAWVAGIFADAQFGDIRGTIFRPFDQEFGPTSNNLSYAAGLRIGYLVTPGTLLYANGGYSHANFKEAALKDLPIFPLSIDKQRRDGWFLGGGIESSLETVGVRARGWFAKIEYRYADYGREDVAILHLGAPNGAKMSFDPAVQTISVSLVYRFN